VRRGGGDVMERHTHTHTHTHTNWGQVM